uniref:Reverse transcriptase domain-containing protein n=1 Tax=Hordeum vulgare subsp. vulgare TaxID=112509 RepID=A0A8I6YB15_HORVV
MKGRQRTRLNNEFESSFEAENERSSKNEAEQRVRVLLREEEMKWALRAKVRAIVQGDNNTKFFHLIANGKHRKKRILQLEQDEGTIVGHENLKLYISNYYKRLFGAPDHSFVSMDEHRVEDIPQVGQAHNESLSAPFLEKEVLQAIEGMKNGKAPGPDGFPAEFYKKCWHIIKKDLMSMFHDLFSGHLQLFHLNFGTITLLPKKKGAMRIEQFRPICLLNVSFKIFTKVETDRLTKMAHSMVLSSQTAFMLGRNILEGVVVLHETLHELHSKKLDGVLFKVDFEKAYDKVNWSFLQQTLRMKGFGEIWRKHIDCFIKQGSVGIKVNDDVGHFFHTLKGLRQGDHMSSILFNIVADMLALMIRRANEKDLVGGLVPHLVDEGVSILQYADDTILFMEHTLKKARNMKLILCLFEQLSGLKINFNKSEFFCFVNAKAEQLTYNQLFGCEGGNLPFTYLEIPIHHRKLTNKEWKCIEDRFEKKLSCWKGKLLSYGGRLVLVNSVLTSMPMFLLSFFEVLVGVRNRLDFYRSRFFWQSDEVKTKYRLARWDIICRPKEQGGLGIENLEVKNRCLLSKWLFRLSVKTEDMWVQILRNKYLQQKTLAQVTARPGDSLFWKGLMRSKTVFFNRTRFIIGNGESTRFWKDTLLGEEPLAL